MLLLDEVRTLAVAQLLVCKCFNHKTFREEVARNVFFCMQLTLQHALGPVEGLKSYISLNQELHNPLYILQPRFWHCSLRRDALHEGGELKHTRVHLNWMARGRNGGPLGHPT